MYMTTNNNIYILYININIYISNILWTYMFHCCLFFVVGAYIRMGGFLQQQSPHILTRSSKCSPRLRPIEAKKGKVLHTPWWVDPFWWITRWYECFNQQPVLSTQGLNDREPLEPPPTDQNPTIPVKWWKVLWTSGINSFMSWLQWLWFNTQHSLVYEQCNKHLAWCISKK